MTEQQLRAIHAQACAAVARTERTLSPVDERFWPLYLNAALASSNVARATLTVAQRKAIDDAERVLAENWEHETADHLREAFAGPCTPAETPVGASESVVKVPDLLLVHSVDGQTVSSIGSDQPKADTTLPKRAVQFRVDIGADTVRELVAELQHLVVCVDRNELSEHSVSGGYHTGYEHWLTISDRPTHEEYVEQLNAYLAARREEE